MTTNHSYHKSMADPFGFLVANIGQPVTVRVSNADRVTGLLLSVDDFNNLMLGEWAVVSDDGSNASNSNSSNSTNVSRKGKRTRGDADADAPSIRFIRGSEVRSISFAVAAVVAAAEGDEKGAPALN